MALADLLARLEKAARLSQDGVSEVSRVQASSGAGFGCNPTGNRGVSEVSGSSATGVSDTPATPEEIAGYHAEPLQTVGCTPDTPATPQNGNAHNTSAQACLDCRHRKTPGLSAGYCAQRTDTAHAYGPGHPLRRLPDDGGAECVFFEGRQ